MTERSIKNLMRGAMWLTVSSLIAKILSAIYRVPFQNMVGDVGFYIFQQVYPLYGIAMTLALSGFPVVISRMLAEADGKIRAQQIILQSIYRMLRIISWSAFILLFVGAGILANMMGDSKLTSLIRVLSFIFLLTPQLSFYRGYFQGQNIMVPTAISQTAEQFIRVVVILLGAFVGTIASHDLYITGALAMSGAVFGGIVALFILRRAYKRHLYHGGFTIWGAFAAKQEKKGIGRSFLKQSIAICSVSTLMILFQLADSFQVYRLMINSGITEITAKSLKGVYDRAQPILQLGLVLSTGLALALVPMITAARVSGRYNQLKRSMLLAMKLTILLAGAETVGLITIMRPLNQMLFETSNGTFVLQLFMPAVFFSSLVIMMSSVLQGFGQLMAPALAVSIGVVAKWCANAWLVSRYATAGAAVATCIGLIMVTVICYIFLKRNANVPFVQRRTLWQLALVLLAMAIIPSLFEWLYPLTSRAGSVFQALISAFIGGTIFLVLALRYRLLETKDFVYLPFGSKLLALSRIVLKNKK